MIAHRERAISSPAEASARPGEGATYARNVSWQRAPGCLGVQIAVLVVVWVFVAALHWDNDGLWFQGDSPRHAANGIFLRDYLQDSPADLLDYSLQYYARYPVTHLSSYPPLFYLLEAGAFALFGPVPQVARTLVLCFALVAALYATVWLRRLVQPEAGWAGALLLLQPGMVKWSHAVALNVPAFALLIGALYHAHRWLECDGVRRGRHLALAVAMYLSAVFTYYPACVALPIMLTWVAIYRSPRSIFTVRLFALVGIMLVAFLPSLYVIVNWAPRMGRWLSSGEAFRSTVPWLYYVKTFPRIVNPYILFLAAAGAIAGLASRSWRLRTGALLTWIGITYLVFSYVEVKSERYVLPALAPVLFLAVFAIVVASRWIAARIAPSSMTARRLVVMASLGLILVHAAAARTTSVPHVSGFREVADYFAVVAPRDCVLYDGYHDGTFAFYMLAGDRVFSRGVVLARKVLSPRWPERAGRPLGRAAAEEAIRQALRTQTGCRWIALQEPPIHDSTGLARWLRAAVHAPDIEYVRTFPLALPRPGRIDVYRWRVEVQAPESLNLRFPELGPDVRYRITPLKRRGSSTTS